MLLTSSWWIHGMQESSMASRSQKRLGPQMIFEQMNSIVIAWKLKKVVNKGNTVRKTMKM